MAPAGYSAKDEPREGVELPEVRKRGLTPEQRRYRARLAALTRWSKTTDRTAATAPARAAAAARFDAYADPVAAKRAHMTRLALRRVKG